MKRQIKFRGKRTDTGEWVFGLYFTTPLTAEYDIKPENGAFFDCGRGTRRHVIADENGCVFDVIPETVGQFTGLCDATRWEDLTKEERGRWAFDGTIQGEWKGREIYEDDIAKWIDSDRNERIDTVSWRNGGMILCNNWYTVGAYLSNRLKIIGNIHDNKDLLTTK